MEQKGRFCCQEHLPISNSLESIFQQCFMFVFPPVSAPNSPLHLSNRAHVLLLLNRPQASLTDADHAVRLRPDWGKVRNSFFLYILSRQDTNSNTNSFTHVHIYIQFLFWMNEQILILILICLICFFIYYKFYFLTVCGVKKLF